MKGVFAGQMGAIVGKNGLDMFQMIPQIMPRAEMAGAIGAGEVLANHILTAIAIFFQHNDQAKSPLGGVR